MLQDEIYRATSLLYAEEQSTTTGGIFTANDRYGEFGWSNGCFRAPLPNTGSWSLAGAATLEIDATLLTVKLLG